MMRKKYIQPISENIILTLKGSVTTNDISVNNKSGDPWTFTNDIDFEEETPPLAPVTKSLWD